MKDKKIDAKKINHKIIYALLLIATITSASVIILIIFQIAERGIRPLFSTYLVDGISVKINVFEFLFGLKYGGRFFYGIGYLIINTIFNVFLSIVIATPIGILTAIFIVKLSPKGLSHVFQIIVEMLAAVPSIVIGMFGQGFIASILRKITSITGNLSLLNTILVLSIMILPTITMMSVTALKGVPKNIEEGSLALGATEIQTTFNVTLKAAKSGIFAGIILSVGRALGEATAVSLVSGASGSGPNFNFFKTTNMLASRILIGFKEVSEGSLDFEIRFTMGLVLIIVILFFNIVLNKIKNKVANYEI
ncbi:phosphate ABC transporter permease subunit PstC [Haploplasma modicum]|uniref:phosphate ABC transporter permease subunit PstC n=1 Tax=Haploplasma modicum TaxID=2150 RepID=UPI00214C2F43|nr:phosphate ABC transporter permease subunit PstC [Haploplasma modicum]MCR1809407.1 phosphate ABC transporter permease subunit PstC [Haploplasma modicum]